MKNREDMYKKRVQRNKVKGDEKLFHNAIQDRSFSVFKLAFLLLLICGVFLTLLHQPHIDHLNSPSRYHFNFNLNTTRNLVFYNDQNYIRRQKTCICDKKTCFSSPKM